MKANRINKFKKFSLLFLLTITFNYGCEKESNDLSKTKNNDEFIKQDNNFITYLNETKDLSNHLQGRIRSIDISESEFLTNFKLAVDNDNYKAKLFISNLMGYEELGFWDNRKKRLEALNELNQNYYLSKLTIDKFYITNKFRSNMMEFIDCSETYKNCRDDVTANYAMDQITCVAAGALGWTGVGALLFVGCEAAANYKMYIGDRNCATNFRNCK